MEFKEITLTQAIELLIKESQDVFLQKEEDLLQVTSIEVHNIGDIYIITQLFNDDKEFYSAKENIKLYERKK